MANFLVNTTNSLNTFFITTRAQSGPPTNYTVSGTDIRNNFKLYMHGTRSKCNYQVGGVDIGTYYQKDTSNFVYNMGVYNFSGCPWLPLDPKLSNAYWIWGLADAYINDPTNYTYWMYYTFYYSGSQNTGTVYLVCDNVCNLYFNSVYIPGVNGGGWGSTTAPSASITIKNGLNYIRISAYNGGGPAGLICAMYDSSVTNVANSDSNWAYSTGTELAYNSTAT
jgi:hypothetical protein